MYGLAEVEGVPHLSCLAPFKFSELEFGLVLTDPAMRCHGPEAQTKIDQYTAPTRKVAGSGGGPGHGNTYLADNRAILQYIQPSISALKSKNQKGGSRCYPAAPRSPKRGRQGVRC